MAKKAAPKKHTDCMLDEIRAVVNKYSNIPEKECYAALCDEASGWEMRLEELEAESDEDDCE